MDSVRLLRKEHDLLVGGHDIPPWVHEAGRHFNTLVADEQEEFPCYFGTNAERRQTLRYTYLERGELAEPHALVGSVHQFISQRPSLGQWSALIVFAGQGDCTAGAGLAQDEKRFWGMMQFLHDHDPDLWPASVPTDPEDPAWEFCFAGRPIFVTGHSPFYEKRRSRQSLSGLMLVIQTRDDVAGILGHGPTAAAVRRRIRGLISSYDSIPPSAELGVYGDPHTREWRQYWLPDEDRIVGRKCPLVIRPASGDGASYGAGP